MRSARAAAATGASPSGASRRARRHVREAAGRLRLRRCAASNPDGEKNAGTSEEDVESLEARLGVGRKGRKMKAQAQAEASQRAQTQETGLG